MIRLTAAHKDNFINIILRQNSFGDFFQSLLLFLQICGSIQRQFAETVDFTAEGIVEILVGDSTQFCLVG